LKAWRHIHEKFSPLALDARNVHLALATNGVNPYKLNHSTWSTWLAMLLLNDNIFPWLTTNFFLVMLALFILGEKLSVIEKL
jgi:hypothetical protein